MSCEYPIIISKLIQVSNCKLSTRLLNHYLFELYPNVYNLYKEKTKNIELYDNEKTKNELKCFYQNDNSRYFEFLYQQYSETKNNLQNIVCDGNNIKIIMPLLHKSMVVFDEIIDTLRIIKIDDNNRSQIKNILGQMIKDKWITEGFFVYKPIEEKIFFCVFDEVYNVAKKEN